jgi:hypothetical protein
VPLRGRDRPARPGATGQRPAATEGLPASGVVRRTGRAARVTERRPAAWILRRTGRVSPASALRGPARQRPGPHKDPPRPDSRIHRSPGVRP